MIPIAIMFRWRTSSFKVDLFGFSENFGQSFLISLTSGRQRDVVDENEKLRYHVWRQMFRGSTPRSIFNVFFECTTLLHSCDQECNELVFGTFRTADNLCCNFEDLFMGALDNMVDFPKLYPKPT